MSNKLPEQALLHDPKHRLCAMQCEEGCECGLIFIACEDCSLLHPIQGWPGCNVDWQFWIKEDPEYLEKKAGRLASHKEER